MSEQKTVLVYEKISAVTAQLAADGIGKKQKNSHQGYNFRGIDDIYNALAPILSKHQLTVLPRIVSFEYQALTTQKGQAQRLCILHIEYDIVASDGSKHTVSTIGEALDTGDKATNKAMAIAYKYMALQTFCIPVVGQDDPDATSHDIGVKCQQLPAQEFDNLIARVQFADTDTAADVKAECSALKAKMSPTQLQQIAAAIKANDVFTVKKQEAGHE